METKGKITSDSKESHVSRDAVELVAEFHDMIGGDIPATCEALKKSIVAGSSTNRIVKDLDAIAAFSRQHGDITFNWVDDDSHPLGGYCYMVKAQPEARA